MFERAVTLALNVVSKGAVASAGFAAAGMTGGMAGGMMGGTWAAGASFFEKAMAFAGKANPAAFGRYLQVFDDISGIIGKIFLPILNRVTSLLRIFADVLMQIVDPLSQLIEYLMEFLDGPIAALAGLVGAKGQSYGAAPRGGSSFVGVSSVNQSAQQAAFEVGAGSPEKEIAKNTKNTVEEIKKLTREGIEREGKRRAIDGTGGGGSF